MDQKTEIKSYLLKSIDSLKEAACLYTDNNISSFTDTSQSALKPANELPKRIDLANVRLDRFLIPIFLIGIIISIVLTSITDLSSDIGAAVIIFTIFALILFFTIKRLWCNSDSQNNLSLDRTGLSYNTTHYSWDEIVTTHLQEISYLADDNNDYEIFLLIGLKTRELITLDISLLNFKGAYFNNLKVEKLASYIESYKPINH